MAAWNKDQAELLRRIALADGTYPVDDCNGPALDALVAAGFVRLGASDRVALTDSGVERARELRRKRPF
jgi:hypothetical protein